MQTYGLTPSRNLIRAEREMLKAAEPIKVLSNFGSQKEQPTKQTDTIVFRRFLPLDAGANGAPDITAASYVLAEGSTPSARTLSPQDVTVTLQNYGVLMKLTSKTELMYEDDIPKEMTKKVGEHMASLEELINFGVIRAGTSVIYTNGSARNTMASVITLGALRKSARQLESAHAARVTERLAPSVNFGTSAVAPSYLVFIHTDMESDFRNLAGFTPIEEYGSFKPAHDREIGKVESFRVITSPYFKPFLAAGASVGGGFVSAGASNNDVYPVIVVAEEAWGQVALKGQGSISPTYLPPRLKNHANPMGLFGYVGADFWKTAVRLNENWMVRIESCATNL
jgi:N4-gp56 family major capsid protein